MRIIDRRNMAVMFTDVVGFTSMMERSEPHALKAIDTVRHALMPLIDENGGRLVKEMGDGTLSLFPEASAAVHCARRTQEILRERDFRIRVGIHWGDVIVQKNDVLGDTVNVSSRVQELAPPGGVCVSGELLRNYGPGRRPDTYSLGLRKLKGLGRLIDLFAVRGSRRDPLPVRSPRLSGNTETPPLTEGPATLAVLPLTNLGPEEDDFYAYSISSDLVSDVTGAGGIIVTPLTDVIRLEKALGSTEDVGERLRVRFLVKGTLWRRDEKFQLSIELVDRVSGRMEWTDSWMDDWLELPSIKGKLADGVLKVIGIDPYRISGIVESETHRSGAYESYLRAKDLYWRRRDSSDVEKTRDLLLEALEGDPQIIPARILLGTLHIEIGMYDKAASILKEAGDLAIEKGDRSSHLNALNWMGINKWKQSDYKGARDIFARTLRMARSMNEVDQEARSLCNIGLMHSNMGNYDKALEFLQKALLTTGPEEVSSLRANTLCNIGLTHWHMGDNPLSMEYYRRALEIYESLEDRSGQAYIMRNIGILERSAGDFEKALKLTERALEIHFELGDRQSICHGLNSKGNILIYLGRYAGARREYSQALKIAMELSDRFTEGIIKTNLGNIAYALGDYREALENHLEALGISLELEDLEGQAENRFFIGDDYRELGETRKARESLESSIEIMEQMGTEARTSMARTKLANVILDLDPDGSWEQVIEQLKEAENNLNLDSADRTATLWWLSVAYGRLSEVCPAAMRKRIRGKSLKYLGEAHGSLMRVARSLSDESLRRSYLEEVSEHRHIISAFSAPQR